MWSLSLSLIVVDPLLQNMISVEIHTRGSERQPLRRNKKLYPESTNSDSGMEKEEEKQENNTVKTGLG